LKAWRCQVDLLVPFTQETQSSRFLRIDNLKQYSIRKGIIEKKKILRRTGSGNNLPNYI
jgi:hypothetical protein